MKRKEPTKKKKERWCKMEHIFISNQELKDAVDELNKKFKKLTLRNELMKPMHMMADILLTDTSKTIFKNWEKINSKTLLTIKKVREQAWENFKEKYGEDKNAYFATTRANKKDI